MEVSKNPKAASKDTPDVAQQYIAAPSSLKNRARASIGAQNDDEAVRMISGDPKIAASVAAILSQSPEEPSLLEDVPQTAPEDVMYPRSAWPRRA